MQQVGGLYLGQDHETFTVCPVSSRDGNEPSFREDFTITRASQLDESNLTKLPSKLHVYLSTYCI